MSGLDLAARGLAVRAATIARKQVRQGSVLVFGDSLVAQGERYRARNGTVWPLLAEQAINPYHWAIVLEPRLRWINWIDAGTIAASVRGTGGANQGVSGETLAQIVARMPAALARYQPDLVIIEGGLNSLTAGVSVADLQAQTDQAVQLALAAGARVILEGVMVEDTAGSAVGANMVAGGVGRERLRHIGEWRRRYAARAGVLFLDPNIAVQDPASTTGAAYPGLLRDGVHFTPRGAFAKGKLLAQMLTTLFPLLPPPIIGAADQYNAAENPFGGLIANPMFVQATPGMTIAPASQLTAGVAAGTTSGSEHAGAADQVAIQRLAGAMTAVATTVPIVDKQGQPRGRGQKLLFTPAGTGTNRFIVRKYGDLIAAPLLPAGTWVRMCGWLQVNADPGWLGVGVSLFDFAASGEQFESAALPPYDNTGSGGLLPFPAEAWSGWVCTPPFQVGQEVTSTGLKPRVEIYLDPTTAVAPSVVTGAWSVRVIDDPRP